MAQQTHGQGAHANETLAHATKAHVHEAGHSEGTMDITAQERTFVGFLRFSMRTAVVILVFLVFLALVNG